MDGSYGKQCTIHFRIWPPNVFECLNKKSAFNSTPILKILSENIEKCKRLFGGVNFAILANRDVVIFGSCFTLVIAFKLILSYKLQKI